MSDDRLYQQCCGAARGLLVALQARDLALIERKAKVMRARLRWRDAISVNTDRERAPLRQEQFEALEAVLEGVERSLASLRQVADGEVNRMNAACALLAHLVVGEGLPSRRHGWRCNTG